MWFNSCDQWQTLNWSIGWIYFICSQVPKKPQLNSILAAIMEVTKMFQHIPFEESNSLFKIVSAVVIPQREFCEILRGHISDCVSMLISEEWRLNSAYISNI